uniref:Uncharacterized protein n=1 Tax=Sphaerodactylus townsendi TaxID=933632 RepID=A0ACB8FDM4_9SAUR
MSSEALEECIQEAEGNQDGTGQALPKLLMEDCEVNERPSAQGSLQSPETDAGELDRSFSHSSLQSPETDVRELDRSFSHTSIPTDGQSISDEGASDSFLSWSENVSTEEVEDIESSEQPSSEGIELDSLDNTLKNQDGLVVDVNSSTEETKVASGSADTDTENIHTTSCIDPENYVNDDTETITGTSSLVIHLVSDVGNKKPITKSHSVESSEGTVPQSDIANVLPKKEDDEFLSQEQSSDEGLQNEMEPSGSDRESMTFHDGRSPSFDTHLDAAKETFLNNPLPKCRHNINTRESNNTEAEDRISPQSALPSHETNETMNDFVQTQENSSSRFDSDEDASSDFLPWSDDYPENEDEIISQGQSTPEDNVFENEISLPQSKQVSFQSSSDTTNSSCSLPETEGATRLNSDHKKNSTDSENQMNSEESEGKEGKVVKEGKTLPETKTIQRRRHCPSGHKRDYSQTFAVSSSYNLPWYKYLLGREQREVLMEAWCHVLENVTAPPASRMYNYISRIKKTPVASE